MNTDDKNEYASPKKPTNFVFYEVIHLKKIHNSQKQEYEITCLVFTGSNFEL